MRWVVKIFGRVCALGSVLAASVCCYSQQTQNAEPAVQGPVFTLKVYTNLVQVPTLVLDHDRGPMRPIDFGRFLVSLDGGKVFAPTHVRMEGADPLDVAILVDVSEKRLSDLWPELASATAEMATKELHPQDRISIYLLSCNLLRIAHEVQPSPGLLSSAIEDGLRSPKVGKTSAGESCGTKVYLWAAMTAVIRDMSVSGRRAMLVISDGRDDGSTISWTQLHEYAGVEGAALFGLEETTPTWAGSPKDQIGVFHSLCEHTGGIVMQGGKRELQKRLEQWIELLRNRYVVEFPRPQALSNGQHSIEVSIRHDGWAFTTLAGVSVSLPDPAITADPNYRPSDQGSDIPVGKRRPLPH